MPRTINEIVGDTASAAKEVYRHLGPGLLQDAYVLSMAHELGVCREIKVKQGMMLPLVYKSQQVERGYSVDLIVEDKVLVIVLALEKALPIHTARLMTMLKLSGRAAGMIINFNHESIEQGITSVILSAVPGR